MTAVAVRAVLVVVAGALGAAVAAEAGRGRWAGALGGVVLGAVAVWLESRAAIVPAERLAWGVAGGLGGLLAGVAVGVALMALTGSGAVLALAAVLGAYLGGAVALRRREALGALVGRTPGAGGGGEARPKLLDTSTIIDGRLADVCATGFVEGPLVVPQFVLRELQQVADSTDALKRQRGKRGFEVLQRLQALTQVTVEVTDRDVAGVPDVDRKLIELTRAMGGKLLTNDYNLNKLAELAGVPVLNVNELAKSLKPVVLPGEAMRVQVLREGKEAGQGVAYLDDGTMVVIDQGRKFVGQTLDVTVTSVLQTSAGRMVFTRPREDERPAGRRDG